MDLLAFSLDLPILLSFTFGNSLWMTFCWMMLFWQSSRLFRARNSLPLCEGKPLWSDREGFSRKETMSHLQSFRGDQHLLYVSRGGKIFKEGQNWCMEFLKNCLSIYKYLTFRKKMKFYSALLRGPWRNEICSITTSAMHRISQRQCNRARASIIHGNVPKSPNVMGHSLHQAFSYKWDIWNLNEP